MKETYYLKESGIVTINYAYEQDGVTIYSDLIKLKVALDNGEVLGIETKGYLNSHEERNIQQAKISKEQAKAATAKAIKADHHLHPALCGLDQNPVQFMTDLVLEQNKGLQEDFLAGLAQGLEHLGEVRLTVFQQLHLVAGLPGVVQIPGPGVIWWLIGGDVFHGAVHNSISTDKGA